MAHRSTTSSFAIFSIPESKQPGMIVKLFPPELLEDQDWLNYQNTTPWAVFHAKKCIPITKQPDISAMLPSWRDDLKSPATIKHLLDVLIHATGYLNPDQAAVIGFDQPLYAIVKNCSGTTLICMVQQSWLPGRLVSRQWLDNSFIQLWSKVW